MPRKTFFETLQSAARRLFTDVKKDPSLLVVPTNIKKYRQKRAKMKPYKYKVGYYGGKKIRKPKSLEKPKEIPRVVKKVPRRLVSKQIQVIDKKRVPTEQWEEPSKTGKGWNEVLDPKARLEAVLSDKPEKVKKTRIFPKDYMSKAQRHLLFMNPGTVLILQAKYALTTGNPLPKWTNSFVNYLSVKKNKLFFGDKEMLTTEDKRAEVKKIFYSPKGSSTIMPITEEMRKYANVTQRDVTNILRSLETYQINFGRRLPPKVSGRMSIKKPGTIACDAFFPSRKFGWTREVGMCLTMMDVYSRFCHIYALVDKKKETVRVAMEDFFKKFASLGWRPLQGLSDKGTDLSPFEQVFEKYRGNKVGPLVFKSVTGQPVLVVEHLNAQVQRRMEIFRTAEITDDPSVLLDDISFQINNQKRPDKENLSPLEILKLNEKQIKILNENAPDRTILSEPLRNMRKIEVGDTVRVLLMDRKKQKTGALKGFQPKWSSDTFTVLKMTRLRNNHEMFRYFVGLNQSYYRHEILLIPKKVDAQIPNVTLNRSNLIAPEENWSDLESDSD